MIACVDRGTDIHTEVQKSTRLAILISFISISITFKCNNNRWVILLPISSYLSYFAICFQFQRGYRFLHTLHSCKHQIGFTYI